MPFHRWEAPCPTARRVAMEVYDAVSEKYPAVLRGIYGDALTGPGRHGAALRGAIRRGNWIAVRLDGTHPERGNRTPEQAVAVVQAVLRPWTAADLTGHNHFDRVNEVMKAVAQHAPARTCC